MDATTSDDERRELDATDHPGMIREGGRASVA
jgi:hypothetical protein